MRYFFILFLTLLLSISGCEEPEYIYCRAKVTKVQQRAFANGYYKWRVYYDFEYNGSKYSHSDKPNYIAYIYEPQYSVGDSTLIILNLDDMEDSRIIERIRSYN